HGPGRTGTLPLPRLPAGSAGGIGENLPRVCPGRLRHHGLPGALTAATFRLAGIYFKYKISPRRCLVAPYRLRHQSDGGEPMRVTIVGGGPAGLYLALLMKKADNRHEITI